MFGRKSREVPPSNARYCNSMTYKIAGLEPSAFAHLFNLSDAELAAHGAVRMTADKKPSFPCRVTLDDAEIGETLLLVNHRSHGGNNPYRATHAIFVSEGVTEAAKFEDEIPPALDRRILSLRAFDCDGMMVDAALAQPGEADDVIRRLFANEQVDHIDAHNAIRGCFAARVDRG